ncbi:MAG: DUF4242 domain-containing protein [Actinobacteria bacterium]|nr:MAG: DUF4242 domain-containing protein [Actinomycetota bacterium]
MPKYVIERDFSIGEERMPEVGRRSRQIIEEQFPTVTWLHSHVTVDSEGHVRSFCVYEAPDEETVREHSRLLGWHKIVGIFEVAGDVTPEDFPLTPEPV